MCTLMENEKELKSKKNKNLLKFVFKIILFFSILEQYNFNQSFYYSNIITLLDGNFFIIHKYGIDIYDPALTTKIKNVITFSDEDQIKNENTYSKVTISTLNGSEYMMCGINDKIYIFNFFGEKIFISDNKIKEIQDKYYSLIPLKIFNNELFYAIGFINDNNNMQLLFYKYDNNNNNKNISLLYNNSYLNNTQKPLPYSIKKNMLTCQLMKNTSKTNIIVCIYYVNSYTNYLSNLFIDTENYSIIESLENIRLQLPNEINDIEGIKSTINSDYSKMFICFYSSSGEVYCLIYSINNNTFSNYIKYLDGCKSQHFEIKFNYIRLNEEYLFSCVDDNNYIILLKLNINFEYLNKSIINNCNYNYGYSMIYSSINEKYIIISDVSCEESNYFFSQVKDIKYKKLRETQETLTNCGDYVKCATCNEKSLSKGLCLTCNQNYNYFPLKSNNTNQNITDGQTLIDCYNNSTKPNNVFFNTKENYYQPCYWTCGSCDFGGDGNQNNCTSCAMDYTDDPEIKGNCVVLCKNYYYYTIYNQYKCSSSPQCPEEKNLLIRKKRKCIDSCLKDREYRYQYNGECLQECPSDTEIDTKDLICKVKNKELCSQSTSQFDLYDFLKEGGVEKIVKTYAKEFVYTNKHISLFKNEVYSIMLYKSPECITELELPMPEIDFGTCYTKVQNKYDIKDSLIIAIVDKSNSKKNNPITSYSFYNPYTGEKLDSETACKEEIIVVKENIKSLLNDSVSDMDSILFLTEQNIDIFNKSSGFFTDLCYHFESPCNKDVALNDRLLVYYPNITLCDSGCSNTGVNLTSMTAICECKYKEMTDEDSEEDTNLYQNAVNEVYNILNQINLGVMACYKDIFESKYFVSCTGGIIMLCLFIIEIIIYIIYYYIGLFYVKKYIYSITDNYLLYLNKSPMYKTFIGKLQDNGKEKKDVENEEKGEKEEEKEEKEEKEENEEKEEKEEKSKDENENKSLKQKNCPPKKEHKDIDLNYCKIHNKKNTNVKSNKTDNQKKMLKTQEGSEDKNSSNLVLYGTRKNRTKSNSNVHNVKLGKSLLSFKTSDKSSTNPITNDIITKKNITFFDQYLSIQLNEMLFNDALIKDKRLFFDYFYDKLKKKYIILDLILINNPIKPKTIKILLLILDIEICFVVNAMFINEDYVSKVFRSTKEENFISFLPRSVNRIIYTIIASFVFGYIIGCLFIEEKRLKSIFKYEKNNPYAIKYEISLIMKEVKWRYNIFIIITAVATVYSWYYLSCFNNIYPHTKIEWIKSSILIILLIHIISIIVILIETLLRFISFEIKSEKMYKASLWLA